VGWGGGKIISSVPKAYCFGYATLFLGLMFNCLYPIGGEGYPSVRDFFRKIMRGFWGRRGDVRKLGVWLGYLGGKWECLVGQLGVLMGGFGVGDGH